ncbi:MAG: EamA family transporter RarD [Thermodesulfobacteriota bacterium]
MPDPREQKKGLLYGLAAFCIWGLNPLYFKAVAHVTPLEVLCHRVIWSVPLTALWITLIGGWPAVKNALGQRLVLLTLLLSSLIVAANWLMFIYAIGAGRVLECSLGYFINPLVNVLLGLIFLRERLRRAQTAAVLSAAAGTALLTVNYGSPPWISLFLAFSFGFYGLLRKTVRIDSVGGLFVETTLLFVPALAYLGYLTYNQGLAFGSQGWPTAILLFSAGAVTSIPLVAFTSAARRLQYSTIGLLQYLAPTLQFLLAVFRYHEPFTRVHLISFSFIWLGLLVFMADSLAFQRKAPR